MDQASFHRSLAACGSRSEELCSESLRLCIALALARVSPGVAAGSVCACGWAGGRAAVSSWPRGCHFTFSRLLLRHRALNFHGVQFIFPFVVRTCGRVAKNPLQTQGQEICSRVVFQCCTCWALSCRPWVHLQLMSFTVRGRAPASPARGCVVVPAPRAGRARCLCRGRTVSMPTVSSETGKRESHLCSPYCSRRTPEQSPGNPQPAQTGSNWLNEK